MKIFKKLLILCILLSINACTLTRSHIAIVEPNTFNISEKSTINYTIDSFNTIHTNYLAQSNIDKSYLAKNNYFTFQKEGNYTLNINILHNYEYNTGLMAINIITLGIIPTNTGNYYTEIDSTLVNNQNGEKTKLPTQYIKGNFWSGWLVGFGAIRESNRIGRLETTSFLDDIYKQAARIVYGEKNNQSAIEAKINEINNAKSASLTDVNISAKYAPSWKEFNKVKAKATSIDYCQSIYNLLFENKNKPIPSQTLAYWEGLDYFKTNCKNKKLVKDQALLGISKKELINFLNKPNATYIKNDDTEILTFNRVYDSGKDYVVNKKTVCTINRGIVAEVEESDIIDNYK